MPTTFDTNVNTLTFVNLMQKPEAIGIDKIRFRGAVTCLTPNYATRQMSLEIIKIDPQNIEAHRAIYQRRVRSNIITKWVTGHFNKASLMTLGLCSGMY